MPSIRTKRIGDFAQKLQGEYHNLQVVVPNNVVYLFCFNRFRVLWKAVEAGPYSLFALPEGVPANPFIARDHLSRKALETIGPEGVN